MRGSLRARVDSLHAGAISTVSSRIIIYQGDKIIKKKSHGTNKEKVIEIIVRL